MGAKSSPSASSLTKHASVSVVVAGRNRYEKLYRTLASLLESEHSVSEIIYVDTGSEDRLISYVKSNFPSVTVRQIASGNPQEARNLGAGLCSGEYVVFCDDDVLVGKETIGNMVRILGSHEDTGAIGCASYSDTSLNRGLNCYTLSTMFWLNREGKFLGNMGVFQVFGIRNFIMFKRSVYMRTGGWDSNIFIQGDETDLHYRMHRLGYKLLMDTGSYIVDQTPEKEDMKVIAEVGLSRRGLGVRNTLYSELKQLSLAALVWIFPSSLAYMFARSIFAGSLRDYADGVRSFFSMKRAALSGRKDSIPRSAVVDVSVLMRLQYLRKFPL